MIASLLLTSRIESSYLLVVRCGKSTRLCNCDDNRFVSQTKKNHIANMTKRKGLSRLYTYQMKRI